MFRSLLRNTGYALVFIGFFFLHGVNEYPGLIPYSVLISLLLKYVLIAVAITLAATLVFRKESHAFLFSLLLLFLYFFFGTLHDAIKSALPDGFFRSYRFFLPLNLLLVTATAIWLWVKKPVAAVSIRFFRMLLIILFLIETGTATYHLLRSGSYNNDLAGVSAIGNIEGPFPFDDQSTPDIFFIVLDEYASSVSLKQEFGFDNSRMDSLFRSNGCFISASSRSNYNITPFSLASTFSMVYLKGVKGGEMLTSKKFVQAMETYRHNLVMDYFARMKYQLKNFGSFEVDYADLRTVPFFVYAYPKLIDDRTAWPRLKREIGWHFTMNNFNGNGFRVPENFKETKAIDLGRNRDNFDSLIHEMQQGSASPRFVLAHLLLPHEPFYLHADGSEVSDTLLIRGGLDERKAYLEQVQYTNSLLEKIMHALPAKGNRPRVVIIEGDHGYRSFGGGANASKEFPNLNVLYFSDGNYTSLYDGISPVNTFRVVLNKYFGHQIPLLKDSSVYIVNPSGSLEK